MSVANLNIIVTERRMLSDADAAIYCGLPAKHFKVFCPVQPVQLGGKVLRFDKRDLSQIVDAHFRGNQSDCCRLGEGRMIFS